MIQIFAKDIKRFEAICQAYNIPKQDAYFVTYISPMTKQPIYSNESTSKFYKEESDWLEY